MVMLPTADPEVEALLREVASDPRSKLLRLPRATDPRVAFEPDPRIASTAAGLTVAERHLLEVHRSDIADLCRDAFMHALFRHPRGKLYFPREDAENRAIEYPGREDVDARAEVLGADFFHEEGTVWGRLGRSQSSASLRYWDENPKLMATIALRLHPSGAARIRLGIALLVEGEGMGAKAVWSRVLRHSIGSDVHVYCHANLALLYGLQGKFQSAARHRVAALQLRPRSSVLAWAVFLDALRLGDSSFALSAAKTVEECVPPESHALEMAIDLVKRQRSSRCVPHASAIRGTVERVRAQLGTSAARIANA